MIELEMKVGQNVCGEWTVSLFTPSDPPGRVPRRARMFCLSCDLGTREEAEAAAAEWRTAFQNIAEVPPSAS